MGKLREHRLYAKASQCEFVKSSTEFLGQQITSSGMTPTEAKLRAVRDWTRLGNVHDVRSFLGFANYYRRFVQNYAQVANPHAKLTKKDILWQWGPYQRKAFQDLKDALCAVPILQFPNPKLPYTVVTDASQTAVGGVLMQDHGEGLKPLAFLSRQLKSTEQRYSAYERELAAVAYCFLAWRHYLEGFPGGVTVIIDHQTLTHIMDQQVLSRAQIRWVRLALFQSSSPTIKYQPGKANIVADALSRSQRGTLDADAKDQGLHKEQKEDEDTVFALTGTMMTMQPAQVKRWKQAQADDPKI